ncbi:MAG: DUF4239 domain-containing protein [Candidatus Eremiobacteraeota bacterium]|nr:DUF4239 domain-containing protein [Candidatus Eremiobacteraeota bacterium]
MNWIFFVLVIAITAAVFATLVWLVRSFVRWHVREGHNDVLVPIFLTAGTLYAVLLAFLVIAVWETYGAAKDNAAEEASTLATMYRQSQGMPKAEGDEMRSLLREYTEAVVNEEWAIQAATGGASPKARHAVAELYRTYGKLPPAEANAPVSVEFLRTFSTVAADRNRRTLQAGEGLPTVLWITLIGGAVIVVAMSLVLYMEVFWPHALMSGLMASLMVAMLVITLVLNRPFAGPLAIDAGSYEHSLSVFKSVDQGN